MDDKSYISKRTNSYLDYLPLPEWKGADLLTYLLLQADVRDVFGVNGGAVLELYDRLSRTPVKIWDMPHEQGAAHAAEGYFSVSGKPGVVIVTSGPGFTNSLTGITDAYTDSRGIVVISGQVPRHMIGKMAFQEAPVTEMSKPVTKYNILVKELYDLPNEFQKVFSSAMNGRPGPTHLDLPKDLQQMKLPFSPEDINLTFEPLPIIDPYLESKLDEAEELFKNSKKPVIYAGGGVVTSRAFEELERLAQLTYSPVVTTSMGRTAYRRRDELNLGMLGMHGTEYANYAVKNCDLLVCIGARFDDRVTGDPKKFAADAKKIHIDVDPNEFGKNVEADLYIRCDARYVLHKLVERLKNYDDFRVRHEEWVDHLNKYKNEHPLRFKINDTWITEFNFHEMLDMFRKYDGRIKPQHVMLELREKLYDEDPIITTGVGRHQMFAAQYLGDVASHFISSCGLGTMGFGLPAAIGANAACPDSIVIDVDGDRSFLMTINQLDAVNRYKLPIKVVVLRDNAHGMVRQWQDVFYNSNYAASTYPEINYVKIANGFGVDGRKVISPRELEEGIKEMLKSEGPFVLEVEVDPTEHVLPMIPPSKSFDDMIVPK